MKHIDIARNVSHELRQDNFVPDSRLKAAILHAIIGVYDRIGAVYGEPEPNAPSLPLTPQERADIARAVYSLTGELDENDCN